MSTGQESDSPPGAGRHDGMMNDVKVSNLVEFLAHHEEDGVEELGKFAHEIQPAHLNDDKLVRIISGVVYWLKESHKHAVLLT